MNPKWIAPFVLLGPPASGKGTMSVRLRDYFATQGVRMAIITPGHIYARLREEDSEIGHLVRETLKDGGYCPNWLTNQIMDDAATRLTADGVPYLIMDGYNRSLEQQEHYEQRYVTGAYLHFQSHFMRMRKAAVHRRSCGRCGAVFSALDVAHTLRCSGGCHSLMQGAEAEAFRAECARWGEQNWKTRWDDSAEFYAKRYKTYMEVTGPVLKRVSRYPNYFRYDFLGSDRPEEELFLEMLAATRHCWAPLLGA